VLVSKNKILGSLKQNGVNQTPLKHTNYVSCWEINLTKIRRLPKHTNTF